MPDVIGTAQRHREMIAPIVEQTRTLSADMSRDLKRQWSYGTGVKPYTPLKRSRRSRLRYRWTMATERFRRSLARRIYDFEDGW